jgi:bacillithiol biosynthesis deacetylase BshB1
MTMQYDLDLLAVMAHPDDAELLCGGTLAKSADRGLRTGVLDLSRGEAGTRGTPEIRAREAEAAAEVLGLKTRRNAGLPDARLANDHEARRRVAELLRELRPRVLIAHWLHGRHPDHRVAAELVRDASFLAGLRGFGAEGEAFRPHALVYATAFREDGGKPSFVVDVTDWMERKLEALACYGSQLDGVTALGEVRGGGDRPLREQIQARMAVDGSLIRVAFGEPFRVEETLALDTPGELVVPTF